MKQLTIGEHNELRRYLNLDDSNVSAFAHLLKDLERLVNTTDVIEILHTNELHAIKDLIQGNLRNILKTYQKTYDIVKTTETITTYTLVEKNSVSK